MRITVTLPASPTSEYQELLNLDVGVEMSMGDLRAVIESDTKIPSNRQVIFYNGGVVADASKTLEGLGVKEGDLFEIRIRQPAQARQHRPNRPPAAASVRDDAEILRLQALGDPRIMTQLRNSRPELADATGDPRRFREIWDRMTRQQEAAAEEREQLVARLNADELDVEAQMKIEEMINEQAVMTNLQDAMENTPEAFGRVHMLYIPVEVNKGHKVKAFVDSGAQATIMSPSCAERCGIMRLLDKRFAGIARGVGTAKILGRVHSALIKIGSLYLACSFTVMEGKDVDLLLGLDMLKRHQACIDLKKGALIIESEEVPFLGEADLPKSEELFNEEPTIEGPSGMQVGGRSGAIIPPNEEQDTSTSSNFQGRGHALGSQAPQTSQPQQPARSFPPEHIQTLMNLGFSRERVIQALEIAQGHVEVAAGVLSGW